MNDQTKSEERRNSSIEFLRIVAMLLIVLHHAFFWGDVEAPAEGGLDSVLYGMGMFAGQIGVIAFFMITGYYMVTQKFTVRKLIRMLLEIWFFSWCILLVDAIFGDPSIFTIRACLFPMIACHWWFVDTYIALMILSPFINLVLNSIGPRRHLLIIFVMFFMTYVGYVMEERARYVAAFGTALTVYALAAYVRKYPSGITENRMTGPVLLASVLIADVIVLYSTSISMDQQSFTGLVDSMYQMMSLNELLAGVGLFLTFKNLRCSYHPIVNSIAASTFAVYLIHESMPVKHVLWSDWLDMDEMFVEPLFVPYVVVCTLAVFLICVVIDKMRMWLIFRPLEGRIDRLTQKVEALIRKYDDRAET